MKVLKAINAIQKSLCVTGITKDRRNTQQSYDFRGIDDVYNVLCPLLAEHGLCIIPRVLTRACEERLSAQNKPIFYVVVKAEFDFISVDDNSKVTIEMFGEAMDSADKATNKAMSAAYKYACLQAFSIPTKGDNDADQTTHDTKPKNNNKDTEKPANKVPNKSKLNKNPMILELMNMHPDFIQAIENNRDIEKAIYPLYTQLKKIDEQNNFIGFLKVDLPKTKLPDEAKKVFFALCKKHGESIGLMYIKETQSWISEEVAAGMGESIAPPKYTH